MKRENRYLVLKLTDMGKYLDRDELGDLDRLVCKVEAGRRRRNAEPNIRCVVVEHDWPEFEKVWGMIEARVDGCKMLYKAETDFQDLPDPEEKPIEVLGQNNPFKSLLDDVEPDPDTVDD